jgi:hypothetical protein
MIDARALFEKSALSIPAEKSRPLWDAWARYEYMYGDLAAVNKLEARFKEVFSNGMSNFSVFNILCVFKVAENEANRQTLHSKD